MEYKYYAKSDPIETIKEQLAQIESLFSRCTNLYHPLAEKFGISDTTLDILCGIEQLGRPCTQKELCEIWYLSKQTVNSCIKQLSEKGFIETKSSSNDFREKLLFLTPKGKELCARSAKLIYSAECAAFAKLSYEERRQLIVLTKKHVDSLENEFKKILESNL